MQQTKGQTNSPVTLACSHLECQAKTLNWGGGEVVKYFPSCKHAQVFSSFVLGGKFSTAAQVAAESNKQECVSLLNVLLKVCVIVMEV